jgi:membrane protease YdiL (CAAX protease family)
VVVTLLILGFPVVLAVGFAVLQAVAPQSAERHGLAFYLLLLLIPLGVVLSSADGRTVADELAWPWFFGLPPGLALLAAFALGQFAGALLFFMEMHLTRRLHAGAVHRPLLRRVLQGQSVSPSVPRSFTGGIVLLATTLAIVTAEEVLWRAFLIRHLADACLLTRWTALVVSGLSFGSIHFHFGVRTVLFKSVAGLVWGGLYLLTASLWTPIVSHFLYNCLVWHHLGRNGKLP